jgi:hypothetical protein
MARSHDRSPSPASKKRIKASHGSPTLAESAEGGDPTPYFAPEVLDHDTIFRLRTSYLAAQPFKYAVVEKLFQDELLKAVKDECLSELNFREKETDIYKVRSSTSTASTAAHPTAR